MSITRSKHDLQDTELVGFIYVGLMQICDLVPWDDAHVKCVGRDNGGSGSMCVSHDS